MHHTVYRIKKVAEHNNIRNFDDVEDASYDFLGCDATWSCR
jgi:hypothetical protein